MKITYKIFLDLYPIEKSIQQWISITFTHRLLYSQLKTKYCTLISKKCPECCLQISLPAIYFLCHHTYHSLCLNSINTDNNLPELNSHLINLKNKNKIKYDFFIPKSKSLYKYKNNIIFKANDEYNKNKINSINVFKSNSNVNKNTLNMPMLNDNKNI